MLCAVPKSVISYENNVLDRIKLWGASCSIADISGHALNVVCGCGEVNMNTSARLIDSVKVMLTDSDSSSACRLHNVHGSNELRLTRSFQCENLDGGNGGAKDIEVAGKHVSKPNASG